MESQSLLQSFAMDKDGRMRSVDEVARGLACECVCPCCGEQVLARQGEVREWHFAHASGAECEAGAEGALHRAAKQVLLESGGMTIPARRVSAAATLPDGRKATADAERPEAWVAFVSAEAEKAIGGIRPDITTMIGNWMLFVEIAVTHFVDAEKAQLIDALGVPTLEIDLADFHHERWDWERLIDAVVESSQQKRWISMLDEQLLQQEAQNNALLAALALPEPSLSVPVGHAARRTRFWIQGRMVDIVERPFGIAIWSPYDPSVNAVIKALMHVIGGRWQPKFKNWLAPLEARDYLFAELGRLSGKPPTQVG